MLRHKRILSPQKFCLLFFIMLQHKLICRSILPILLFKLLVVTEDTFSRKNFCLLPILFKATGASLSRQFLPCVDILLKTLSQHKHSLSQLTCYILPIFFCDIAHLSIFRLLCCDKGNIVMTEFLCHFLRSLL